MGRCCSRRWSHALPARDSIQSSVVLSGLCSPESRRFGSALKSRPDRRSKRDQVPSGQGRCGAHVRSGVVGSDQNRE
jgi:hypothetical protein